ncbi:peptidylprolyl isomerase [Candidatus Uhrbacteria bacterium]|nr:peptidylprolyl isomerase [Candidatus Uhrbacteria bacterium]
MQPDFKKPLAKNISVTLETSKGKIVIKLFPQEAPKTVNNFIQLAQQNFYDGTTFHRVIKDFMIQGGDPNSKDTDWSNDGMGGPGYKFEDEINPHKLVKGALAMANSGPNTNGSQFFIVTASETPWLDGKHTVFGQVTSGLDVVGPFRPNSKLNTVPDYFVQFVLAVPGNLFCVLHCGGLTKLQ